MHQCRVTPPFQPATHGDQGKHREEASGEVQLLMQVLADEVDGIANVRANSVNPGATRTDMRAQAYPGENPANNPLPEAIMPIYLYLMGPDSTGVNGQAFDAQ